MILFFSVFKAALSCAINKQPDNHNEVAVQLFDIASQWYELGICLNVCTDNLQTLQGSCKVKLSLVLVEWENQMSPPFTWATVLDVVSDSLKNKRLRKKIEKYLMEKPC